MKKIISILAIFVLSFTLFGCANNPTENVSVKDEPSRFVTVEESYSWAVVYDKYTKVMYAVSNNTYNRGNFTMLVAYDGSPLLYSGEE